MQRGKNLSQGVSGQGSCFAHIQHSVKCCLPRLAVKVIQWPVIDQVASLSSNSGNATIRIAPGENATCTVACKSSSFTVKLSLIRPLCCRRRASTCVKYKRLERQWVREPKDRRRPPPGRCYTSGDFLKMRPGFSHFRGFEFLYGQRLVALLMINVIS